MTARSILVASPRPLRNPGLQRLCLLNQLKAECALPARDPLQFRSHALQLLRGTYLPAKPEDDSHPTPVSWLEAVGDMRAPCDALDYSLLAFCNIQVRLAGEDSITYDDTVQTYNHALGNLIGNIDYGKATCDEMLCSIVLVSTCEVRLNV